MKTLYLLLGTVILSLAIFSLPVSAAKPDWAGGGNSKPPGDDGGSGSVSSIGYDVSYPQCGRNLPDDFAFAIIGVNGGLATTYNECLADQLQWAQGANGSTSQDKVQLYVNTGNPWDDRIAYEVTTWPTDNIDQNGTDTDSTGLNPYGPCVKTPGAYLENTNSEACSWQYGWERAIDDVETHFAKGSADTGVSTNPQDYKWWLDVEITNSWQVEAANSHDLNRITLEGMLDYFIGIKGLEVGIYSTNYQFGYIVGDTVNSNSRLYGLESWLAGARNSKDAEKMCTISTPLTPTSTLTLVQYVSKNLDHNVVCN